MAEQEHQWHSDNLVSIIMPVYNSCNYVAESIQSVLSQSYSKIELIVVNDGSTDASLQIVKSFIDDRIVIINQENKGVSAARNAGLQVMRGEFFCFLDADDCYPQKSVESRLRLFVDNSISFVDGTVEIYDQSMSTILRTRTADFFGNPFDELIKINPKVFFGPSWMIRKKKGIDYQFEESLTHTEDLWFYFQIASHGNFSFTTDVILKYRTSPNSAMTNLAKLAKGYSQLTVLVLRNFGKKLSCVQQVMWVFRVRKIMALSFAKKRQIWRAIEYGLTGR